MLSILLIVFVAIPIIRAVVTHLERDSAEAVVVPALGATGELSVHDQSVTIDIASQIQRFNAAALPLVIGYNEDGRAVASPSARRHITKMWNATTAMVADVRTIEDHGLRDILLRLSSTLGEEVQAMIELYGVAPRGPFSDHVTDRACFFDDLFNATNSCERQALRHLRRAAAERQELAVELVDWLRPYVDPATLGEILLGTASR